tara:strand:+ start:3139 stop:3837 length:699 start_codon:yes stop_codon:yes gene_type:complete
MSLNLDDLQAIIEEATRRAFKEKISPLIENEDERERQKKVAKDIKDLQSGSKKSGDLDEADDEEKDEEPTNKAALGKEDAPEGDGDAPSAVMPTADDMAEADVGQIINMLNMLRSGKSTKDETVKKQLGDYFDGLPPGDRQALFVLLSGLTQILTSGVGGASAPAPAKVGIKISAKQKKKDDEDAEDRIKNQAKADAGSDEDGEETEEMKPIVVGESQNKDWIYRILERNRS